MAKKLLMLGIAALLVAAMVHQVAEHPQVASAEGNASKLDDVYNRGLDFLMKLQAKDGSWADPEGKPDVAFTAIAISTLAGGPKETREKYAAQAEKAIQYILGKQQPKGGFFEPDKLPALANYKTAISIMALAEIDGVKYKDAIIKARDYLCGTQFSETYCKAKPTDWYYGGWGYEDEGDDEVKQKPSPDMSNASMAMEALKAAGLPPDSEAWKRAVTFLNRCQNRSESNDLTQWLKDNNLTPTEDGGFNYRPNESHPDAAHPEGKGLRSYGSMTYAGLKSFLYANVAKDDPRVKAAFTWIQKHYTLDENPELGPSGQFYYYHTFAKAMDAYGEETLSDASGAKHEWASELAAKLGDLQKKDGSWTNEKDRWMEGSPGLVTSYCLRALNMCRKHQAAK